MILVRVTHDFDRTYWEDHWRTADRRGGLPPHPYLSRETLHLPAGTALDAGCGTGSEALRLAAQGWRVTATDISSVALTVAAERARSAGLADRIEWIETDLSRWEPRRRWDLVTTSYAHSDTGQLNLYRRLSHWVRPRGTLLIVGHSHASHAHPEAATADLEAVTALFTPPRWHVDSRYENTRTIPGHTGQLRDFVVRATASSDAAKGTPAP